MATPPSSSSAGQKTVIHLRAESKPLEHRSALSPTTAKALLDAGYEIHVERSPQRIFEDEEFERVGCKLLPEGCWPSSSKSHLILGLKELPEASFVLSHVHIQFAHCYKKQAGWESVLRRFAEGGGTLLDLEFLHDEFGRRVAAFGYYAGFAGAALGIEAWGHQILNPGEELGSIVPYPNEDSLIEHIKRIFSKVGKQPRVLVMGALGRCGTGAVDLCVKAGVSPNNILRWDIAETAKEGPFVEIIESDIFINCIYLSSPIPPFIDQKSLDSPERKLSVVVDVSCDTTNPHNPIPIYNSNTTFKKPTLSVAVANDPPLSVISIDHLPTLLPREASEAFSQDLLPSLLRLRERHKARVWKEAENLFHEMVSSIP